MTVHFCSIEGERFNCTSYSFDQLADSSGDTDCETCIHRTSLCYNNDREKFIQAVFCPTSRDERQKRKTIVRDVAKEMTKNSEIVPHLFSLTDRVGNLGSIGAMECVMRIAWLLPE